MTSKKLGALLRSVPAATVTEPPEQPIAMPPPVAGTPAPFQSMRVPAQTDREVPLQVLIPAHIRKQLAHKAAEEGQSLRALMLRAIRSLGVTVTDAEIKGKRGRQRA